jgi:threonine/homoserine/homoserine lactone efflux protein
LQSGAGVQGAGRGVELPLFVKGLIVGIAIAAPVGPIALLCIQRSISGGWRAGLASGLGAALADSYYGAVAALALSLVQHFLLDHRRAIAMVGGTFLCLLGVRTLLTRRKTDPAKPKRTAAGLLGDFASTFMLTLANPMTIVAFIAIFAVLDTAAAGQSFAGAMELVLGVLIGSAAWWLCLSLGVGILRHRLDEAARWWITRISGGIIIAFGAYSLALGLIG